jgi:arylformamidase
VTQPDVTSWIDVSVTIRHGMPHWPDNPPIVLKRVMDLSRGDDCNLSYLAMGVHSGTHMTVRCTLSLMQQGWMRCR